MLVLPDGCRDFIIKVTHDGVVDYLISPLDDTARYVDSHAGDRYFGWRLHPGACLTSPEFSTQAFAHWATQNKIDLSQDREKILSLMDDVIQIDTQLQDALDSLKIHRSIGCAARDLGISERSLQRWVTQKSGRTPSYWRGLARVRQAAQAMFARAVPLKADLVGTTTMSRRSALSLAELAADFGYADQAHLCRDFQRWFATSPSAMLQSTAYHELIVADGYA
jgi:AraC-like DNA-binding protein